LKELIKNSKSSFSLFGIKKIKNPRGKKHKPKSHDIKVGLNEYEKFRVLSPLDFSKMDICVL
jgi:hypothetical protein